mgnify:CR=1 FL=1
MRESPQTIEWSYEFLKQHYTLGNLPLDKMIQSGLLAISDVDVRKECLSKSSTGRALELTVSYDSYYPVGES